jgi:hypothetical protein
LGDAEPGAIRRHARAAYSDLYANLLVIANTLLDLRLSIVQVPQLAALPKRIMPN